MTCNRVEAPQEKEKNLKKGEMNRLRRTHWNGQTSFRIEGNVEVYVIS
jgi:hypothetical protein